MRIQYSPKPVTVALMAVLFIGVFVTPSSAETFVPLGTHSKDEINKACDDVGGIQVEGQGGKGYGCYNQKTGVLVACDVHSECGGFIPKESRSGLKELYGVLHDGMSKSAADGGEEEDPMQMIVANFTSARAEVAKTCNSVGGSDMARQDGHGYGCYNPKNGVLVACANSGTCSAWIPRVRHTGLKTLYGILTYGLSKAPADTGTGGGQPGGGGGSVPVIL